MVLPFPLPISSEFTTGSKSLEADADGLIQKGSCNIWTQEFLQSQLPRPKVLTHTLTSVGVGNIKGNTLGMAIDDFMMNHCSSEAAPSGFAHYDFTQMDFRIGGTSESKYYIIVWQTYLWAWR